MIEYNELKNAATFLNTTYDDFEQLSIKQIKKNICDAAHFVNHLIDINTSVADPEHCFTCGEALSSNCPRCQRLWAS